METKIYLVRLLLWLAAIVVVAWPLHLARPEIGDMAYIASAAGVLFSGHWLGLGIAKKMAKAHEEPGP